MHSLRSITVGVLGMDDRNSQKKEPDSYRVGQIGYHVTETGDLQPVDPNTQDRWSALIREEMKTSNLAHCQPK